METITTDDLRRTSSQNSTSSSRKSSTTRVKPRKHASSASLKRARSPSDPKSLTSFPSLSPTPDTSPILSRLQDFLPNTGSRTASIETTKPDAIESDGNNGDGNKPANGKATVRKVSRAPQSLVGSLVAAPPATKTRSALFDDTPRDAREVPGNLHHASDESIEHAMLRGGAVALVRQLAADLAQRDAQMTGLRRKAEERERILRKMLQECEVSNLDIETRLRELERSTHGSGLGVVRTRKRRSDAGLVGSHPEDSMGERLAQALRDEHADHTDTLSLLDDVSIAGSTVPDADRQSIISNPEGPNASKDTVKNWRTGWFGGNLTSRKSSRAPSIVSKLGNDTEPLTRSRASSGAKSRKALSNDLFMPPPPAPSIESTNSGLSSLQRIQSGDQDQPSSRKSSISVTGWALRLVAGNIQPTKEVDKGTIRGRPPGVNVDSQDRTGSTDSARTGMSTGRGAPNGTVTRGRALPSSLGPNGTVKNVSPESMRNASGLAPSSPHLERNLSTLGPVEMDTILPEESRPPTLMQHHNNFSESQEFLTDRFGFIYDQRRKKRQSEAAAALRRQKRSSNISNVESIGDAREAFNATAGDGMTRETSRPKSQGESTHSSLEEHGGPQSAKKWQDFLKLATFPTELLSHTPSVAPITSVEGAESEAIPKAPQVAVQKRGSVPAFSANPEPSPSRIFSGNAEFATPALSVGTASPVSPANDQADPVKALLEQLTELHDSLQRDKTVRWNEFLRKVRAERKREGAAAITAEGRPKNLTMPEALMTDGEIIGVAGLGNKGKVGRAKWKEFKQLVLGGIPVAYRAKIWAECSGASALRVPGYYEDLVKNGSDDPVIVSQIQMDITRTLTDNIFFRRGPGVHKLNEVLLAYSRRNPEVGYCQGMNLITACLLLIMPTAEDAFWVLATMIENILPEKYYDHSLLTSRADQHVLRQYVTELLPKLSSHLDNLSIELEALTFQWFLSVFTDCLSAEALFRVWDVVLCMHDGSTFLFQVALALLKLNEGALLECDNPAAVYHYINHQMTNHAISIDGLIQASDALKKVVRRKEVEERRAKAVEREKEVMKQREELRAERAEKARLARLREDEGGASDEMGGNKAGQMGETFLTKVTGHDAVMENTAVASPHTPRSRTSSTKDDEDILAESVEELQIRTPMPHDEEAMWRA